MGKSEHIFLFFPLMRSQSFCGLERKRRDRFSNLQERDLGSLFLLGPRFFLLSSQAQ